MSIGFEEILGLLFFVLFVIVPLFSKRGKAPGKAPQPPAGTPRRPAAPLPDHGGTPAGHVTLDTSPQEPSTWGDILQEVRRRVAAAEAAQAEASMGSPSQPGGASPQPQPAATGRSPQPRPRPQQVQQRTSGSLVSSPASGLSPARSGGLVPSDPQGSSVRGRQQPSSLLGREGSGPSPAPRADSPSEPMQVTRLARQGRSPEGQDDGGPTVTRMPSSRPSAARLSPASGTVAPRAGRPLIGTSKDDLIRGMLWHEILSEPVAAKRLRRIRSRHQ